MKRAFTLIELLIVIVIIGVLTTVITVAIGQSRIAARDTHRKGDLKILAAASEQYWADNRCYPNTGTPQNGKDYLHADTIVGNGANASIVQSFIPKYLNPVPEDPKFQLSQDLNDHPYEYESKDVNGANHAGSAGCLGITYRFVGYLENQSDPDLTDAFKDGNGIKYLQLASPGWVGGGNF